jgi:periplasmic divalent cation tolerance protein
VRLLTTSRATLVSLKYIENMTNGANELLVVLSTFPSAEAAGEAAHVLVGEGLCACVNILPHMRSIYQWQGEVANNAESLCLIKTTRGRYAELEARIRELHTYDVPEVIALPAAAVSDGYLAWVIGEVASPG